MKIIQLCPDSSSSGCSLTLCTKKFCITFKQSSFQYSLIFLLVFVSAFLCFSFPDESYCKSRFSYTVILKRHQRLKVFFFFIFMSLTVTKVTCVYVKRRVNLFFCFFFASSRCMLNPLLQDCSSLWRGSWCLLSSEQKTHRHTQQHFLNHIFWAQVNHVLHQWVWLLLNHTCDGWWWVELRMPTMSTWICSHAEPWQCLKMCLVYSNTPLPPVRRVCACQCLCGKESMLLYSPKDWSISPLSCCKSLGNWF